jgi:hypothetical protein
MNGEDKRMQVIDGKVRGKKATTRPRHRWVNNNKMDLGQIECAGEY